MPNKSDPGSWITNPMMHNQMQPECEEEPLWTGTYCSSKVVLRRVAWQNLVPFTNFKGQNIKIIWENNPAVTNLTEYYNNASNYQQIVFRTSPNPANAWVFPVAVGQMYKIHWRNGLDFNSLQMDWSVLSTASDNVTVFHQNFTAVRAAYHVYQANNKTDPTYNMTYQLQQQMATTGATYPGAVLGEEMNMTTAALSTTNLCDYSFKYQVKQLPYQRDFYIVAKHNQALVDKWGASSQTCGVEGVQCIGNCNGKIHGGPNISSVMYWSREDTWVKLYELNNITGKTGMPADGDSIVVPNTMAIMYDIPMLKDKVTGALTPLGGKNWTYPPKLNTVEIRGRLQFETEFTGITVPTGKELYLELNAKTIFNRGGQFWIHGGFNNHTNDFNPYPSTLNAKVVLAGRYGDPAFAFTNEIEGGNKIIINTGNFTVVGAPILDRTKGSLYASIMPGDTTAKIAKDTFAHNGSASNNLDWGMKTGYSYNITVAASDILQGETEEFLVTVKDNTNSEYVEVNLDHAAAYKHIGAPASSLEAPCTGSTSRIVDYRAEVASWAKNVMIVGTNQEPIYSPLAPYFSVTNNDTEWGGTVLHANYKEVDPNDPTNAALDTLYYSESLMKDVEMYNCSQMDTQKAFIRFVNTNVNMSMLTDRARFKHRVENCAFHDGLSWGIYIFNSSRINFDNNIVARSRVYGVVVSESKDVNVTNNWVMFVMTRVQPPGSTV